MGLFVCSSWRKFSTASTLCSVLWKVGGSSTLAGSMSWPMNACGNGACIKRDFNGWNGLKVDHMSHILSVSLLLRHAEAHRLMDQQRHNGSTRPLPTQETVQFDEVDGTKLSADLILRPFLESASYDAAYLDQRLQGRCPTAYRWACPLRHWRRSSASAFLRRSATALTEHPHLSCIVRWMIWYSSSRHRERLEHWGM